MYRNCCILLSTLLLLVSFSYAQKQKQVDKRIAGLDTALSRLLKEWNVAGFAVAVVEKDKIVYSKGFGYRDFEAKKPVTPNTLFAVGSCTKAFTSSLLGMLEKDGALKLDDKVTKHLPDLKFYNTDMNESLTLRDLMCHRTGLPRHDYSWYYFTSKSRDTLLRRIQYLEPSAGIRQKWQYNNFMFLVQGAVTEKITGKTWEQNVAEKIFQPLNMTRSNFSVADMAKDGDASIGYDVKNDSIINRVDYYNIDAMGPAGSINSSVNEMANWVITWINDGKFKGNEVLGYTFVKDAISGHMVIGGGYPGKDNPDIHFSNYGLGWAMASYRGHYRVEHGGNIDGFSASTCYFPSDSIGIVVLVNQNGSPVPSLARNIIADRMLKLPYINWSGDRKKEIQKAKQEQKAAENIKTTDRISGTKPSHPLGDYEGNFNNPGYGDIEVYARHDSLFARLGKDSVWLRHHHYDVFEAKGYDKVDGLDTTQGGTKLNFRTGDDGKISSISTIMDPSVKAIEFTYQPKAKSLDKDALAKYVGEYELPGMLAKVFLKGDVLYVLVPGQPEYETVYTGNHTFKLKALDGFSVRFEVTNETVQSMSFIQPNGTFKAKRKQ